MALLRRQPLFILRRVHFHLHVQSRELLTRGEQLEKTSIGYLWMYFGLDINIKKQKQCQKKPSDFENTYQVHQHDIKTTILQTIPFHPSSSSSTACLRRRFQGTFNAMELHLRHSDLFLFSRLNNQAKGTSSTVPRTPIEIHAGIAWLSAALVRRARSQPTLHAVPRGWVLPPQKRQSKTNQTELVLVVFLMALWL